MMTLSVKTKWNIAMAVALLIGGTGLAAAEEIKLKTGQTLSAKIMRRDGQNIYLLVPRATVESVGGMPLPPPVVEGAIAPDFSATDTSGVVRTMADNRGHVTLLQFWASWCPHCRHDLPIMKTFAETYQGLRIVTVSIDRDLNTLKTFMDKEQIQFPVIYANDHPDVTERYETGGVPQYFLIAKDGTIQQIESGSITESPSDFPDAVANLLGVASPGATSRQPGPSAASAPPAN